MKKGFTLIELLVVISIIGLLSSVVLTSLSSARVRARDARRLVELNQLAKLISVYASVNSNLGSLDVPGCDTSIGASVQDVGYPCPTTGTQWGTITNIGLAYHLVPSFAPSLPVDPVNNNTYKYVFEPHTQNGSSTWCLYTTLERNNSQFRIRGGEGNTFDSPCNTGAEVSY